MALVVYIRFYFFPCQLLFPPRVDRNQQRKNKCMVANLQRSANSSQFCKFVADFVASVHQLTLKEFSINNSTKIKFKSTCDFGFSRNFVLFRTKIQWAASAQKPLRSFSYYNKCQRGGMVTDGEQISFCCWKRPFVFPLLPESSSVLYEARMWPSPKCKKNNKKLAVSQC